MESVWADTEHQTFPCPLLGWDEKGGAVQKEHIPPNVQHSLGNCGGVGCHQAEVIFRAAFWVGQQLN